MRPAPMTRREMLTRSAGGFGAVALSGLWADGAAHHAAKAKAVIFLYMDGGPSQLDTFDYKPVLAKYHGRNPHEVFKVEPTQFANVGKVLQSPWQFKQRGQSGAWVSELFPEVAKVADELAIVKSVTSKFPEHTSANYFLHTGAGVQGRPSWGAWCGYGLGAGNRDLPTFLVLNSGLIPPGGLDNFNSGFLPAAFQGSVFRAGNPAVANIAPPGPPGKQRQTLDLVRRLDQLGQPGHPPDEVDAAIANAETAFRMQSAVPELTDISKESAATRALYGVDSTFAPTAAFATQCLIARRLVERGAKFLEVTCPDVGGGADRWDQHSNLKKGHQDNARATDQPVAALLTDLKQRGLLDTTLVVWGGEFGRTPFAQGADGRDHNQYGFTVWLAGGGVRPGVSYGATDDFGYKAVADRVEVHDLHATMLHLLGLDHTKLTFRFGGRDVRLTDVSGQVLAGILK